MICAWHITLLEASTGRILAEHFPATVAVNDMQGRWNMSGDVCLLEELDSVLVFCPHVSPASMTFQLYRLSNRSAPVDPCNMPRLRCPSLSPCGSTVISIDRVHDMRLQHWQIPQTSVTAKRATSASERLQPIICTGLIAGLCRDGHMQEAWHPLHSTCIYAVSCIEGGVHLIDARANRCVHSWTEQDLHGPAMPSDPADIITSGDDDTSFADEPDDFDHEDDSDDYYIKAPHALSWSKDGCRLAVASCASLTHGARCCVLHFSDSST